MGRAQKRPSLCVMIEGLVYKLGEMNSEGEVLRLANQVRDVIYPCLRGLTNQTKYSDFEGSIRNE